jgi:antitoxin component HigA of HigAB toxin-antitoxin module
MIATRSYQDLIRRFPLHPIHDVATLEAAAALVDELAARNDLNPEEHAYLEVLGDQIERYEGRHHPVPDASPGQVLAYRMEARGLTGAALSAETGLPTSPISEGHRRQARAQQGQGGHAGRVPRGARRRIPLRIGVESAGDSPLASVPSAMDTGCPSEPPGGERARSTKSLDRSPRSGGFELPSLDQPRMTSG